MQVASLELCKQLYELKPEWNDTFWNYSRSSGSENPFKLGHKGSIETREVKERYPAYDSGYLLRKLPAVVLATSTNDCSTLIDFGFGPKSVRAQGDTPEDALCKLAIAIAQNPKTEKE